MPAAKTEADDIILLRSHTRDTMASTPLLPVGVEIHPLDIVRLRDGDEHRLVLDQILGREIACVEGNLRSAGVAELQGDLGGLAPDLVLDVCLGREDRLEPADLCFEIVLLIRLFSAAQAPRACGAASAGLH